jgi:hypothetical protein
MFGKVALACTLSRQAKALRGYIECEQDVRNADQIIGTLYRVLNDGTMQSIETEFQVMSAKLFSEILNPLNRKIDFGLLTPGHGPGSTADGLLGNQKYDQTEWTTRLETVFKAVDFLDRLGTYLNPTLTMCTSLNLDKNDL